MDHGYHGKPRHKVPAPQFPTFIKVWEAEVVKMQERVKRLEGFHRPYEVVAGVFVKASLVNDVKIQLEDFGVQITIGVLHNDRKELFDRLLRDIHEELVSWRLRDPSKELPNWTPFVYDFHATMHVGECRLRFTLDVPMKGTAWIKITETKVELPPRHYETHRTEINAEWLEEPQDLGAHHG